MLARRPAIAPGIPYATAVRVDGVKNPAKAWGDACDDGYGKKKSTQSSASCFLIPANHEGINDHGRAAEADGRIRETGSEAREQAEGRDSLCRPDGIYRYCQSI